MAKKGARHGRTLIVFLLAVLAMYGGLALNNDWSPKLGLDLQGGTRITLEASTETGEEITPEKLDEAAGIIDSRVNAYGVAELPDDEYLHLELAPGVRVKALRGAVVRNLTEHATDPHVEPAPDHPTSELPEDPSTGTGRDY